MKWGLKWWVLCGLNERWCTSAKCQLDKKRQSVFLYLLIQTHCHYQRDTAEERKWTPAAFHWDIKLVFLCLQAELKEFSVAYKGKQLKTLILTQIFFILSWNWAWSLGFKKLRTASNTSVVIFLCWNSSIWAIWIQCQALTVPVFGSDQLALCSLMTETHQSRLKHFQLPQAPDFPAKYALTQMVLLNFLLRYTAWALEIIIKSCFSCSLEKVKVCC